MSHNRSLVLVVVACAALAGCRKDTDTPKGAAAVAAKAVADTGNPLGATPAAGGVAAVTPTDAKSVTRATEYRLTEDNFTKFLAATDSLNALRKRDTSVARLLDQQINDTGAEGTKVSGNNAGRVHLESNPAISNAITGAGLSVRDYFVAAIAIAQAERFMGNPKAAPPTPTLGPNAEFLNAHKAQLDRLHAAR